MLDWSVVGGGIGGVSIAGLKSRDSDNGILFEKLPYLGGCAGTFRNKSGHFNVGATTLIGYEEGMPLEQLCRKLDISLNLEPQESGMDVLIGDEKIRRYRSLECFLEELLQTFPHQNNPVFWKLIYRLNRDYWKCWEFYYDKQTPLSWMKTLWSLKGSAGVFGRYLYRSALGVVKEYFPDISPKYLQFLNAQVRIVAQADLSQINFATAALALGYTFNQTYYMPGGGGGLFATLSSTVSKIAYKTPVEKIEQYKKNYIVHTRQQSYETRQLFLNSTLFESADLFDDRHPLRKRFESCAEQFDSVGAFTLYLTFRSKERVGHHYQILLDAPLPYIQSDSIFVSFADQDDPVLVNNGLLSATISTHTPVSCWLEMAPGEYREKKSIVQEAVLGALFGHFPQLRDQLVYSEAGTPKTFKRYIRRSSVGGIPLKREYFTFRFPAPNISGDNLYLVGDTVFPGQGWPGVVMGVLNAYRVAQHGAS